MKASTGASGFSICLIVGVGLMYYALTTEGVQLLETALGGFLAGFGGTGLWRLIKS